MKRRSTAALFPPGPLAAFDPADWPRPPDEQLERYQGDQDCAYARMADQPELLARYLRQDAMWRWIDARQDHLGDHPAARDVWLTDVRRWVAVLPAYERN